MSQANHYKYMCVCALLAKAKQKQKTKKTNWNRLGEHICIYVCIFVVGSLYIAKMKWAKPPFILSTDKLHIFKEVCNNQSNAKKRFLHHISIHLFNFSSVLHLTPIYERYVSFLLTADHWGCSTMTFACTCTKRQGERKIYGEIRGNYKQINSVYTIYVHNVTI